MKKVLFPCLFLALLTSLSAGFSFAGDKDLDGRLIQAARVIKSTYGHKISYSAKNKFLLKFGRNSLVGTTIATVMDLPVGEEVETYVTTNLINKFSSSSGSDTEILYVEGHTCTGGVPTTFVSQTVTLAGQTETALTTALCRVSRVNNANGTNLVGSIYIYEDDTVSSGVPQTATKIHLTIPAGHQTSHKASTSFSSTDYAICTQVYGSVIEKASSYVDFEIQIRKAGKVFSEVFEFTTSATGGATRFINLDPPIIVTPSADIRLMATADGANTGVSGGFNCYLAKIQ